MKVMTRVVQAVVLVMVLTCLQADATGEVSGIELPEPTSNLEMILPVRENELIVIRRITNDEVGLDFSYRMSDRRWVRIEPNFRNAGYTGVGAITSCAIEPSGAWLCIANLSRNNSRVHCYLRLNFDGTAIIIPEIAYANSPNHGVVRLVWLKRYGLVAVVRKYANPDAFDSRAKWIGPGKLFRYDLDTRNWLPLELSAKRMEVTDIVSHHGEPMLLSTGLSRPPNVFEWAILDANTERFEKRSLELPLHTEIVSFGYAGERGDYLLVDAQNRFIDEQGNRRYTGSSFVVDCERVSWRALEMPVGLKLWDLALTNDQRVNAAFSESTKDGFCIFEGSAKLAPSNDKRVTFETRKVFEFDSTLYSLTSVKVANFNEQALIYWRVGGDY
ncbi:hypothetical protein [Novipirellula sp.]|uniref:hypothetical protein n=1 Tax=Novipirellula sp. TaxID=2795430 RepID=UPI003568EBAC